MGFSVFIYYYIYRMHFVFVQLESGLLVHIHIIYFIIYLPLSIPFTTFPAIRMSRSEYLILFHKEHLAHTGGTEH